MDFPGAHCAKDDPFVNNPEHPAMSGFANVVGAIDCSHVALRVPSEDGFVNTNCKNVHTIKVQDFCDSNIVLTNYMARRPVVHTENREASFAFKSVLRTDG